MIFYIIIGVCGIIFSGSLIYFRKHFFLALESTLALANAVLSNEDELIKHKKLIKVLKTMMFSLGVSLGLLLLTIALTCLPVYLYKSIAKLTIQDLDLSSIWFILSLSIGSILPFLIKRKKPTEEIGRASCREREKTARTGAQC